MQKIVLILLPILVIALVLVFLFRAKILPFTSRPTTPIINISGNQLSAPNLSALTQPVTRFQGKIEKVENQALVLTGRPLFDTPLESTSTAAQAILSMTTRVIINSATEINRISPLPPSSASASSSTKISVQDLKAGQMVNILSSTDLRNLKTAEFTAKTITLLPSPQSTIRGKISNVKSNAFALKTEATPAVPIPNTKNTIPAQAAKTYAVTITKDILILAFSSKAEKQTNLTIADLKDNDLVTVFTEDNLNQTSIKASEIIVLPTQ